MKGTEKQIKWAEDILSEGRTAIVSMLEGYKRRNTERVEQDKHSIFEVEIIVLEHMLSNFDKAAEIAREGDAARIIDRRHYLDCRAINNMFNDTCRMVRNGVPVEKIIR